MNPIRIVVAKPTAEVRDIDFSFDRTEVRDIDFSFDRTEVRDIVAKPAAAVKFN